MTGEQSIILKDKSGLILIIIGLVLMGGALFYYLSDDSAIAADESSAPKAPVAGKADNINAPTPEITQDTAEFDLDTAMQPRTLGSDDAPVKIFEYASLTCGHCANFHTQILPAIKESYIDTGKVQFIFNDFPLNKPALQASMIARCLPEDQYVSFVDQLMAEQKDWAFTDSYLNELEKRAKDFGLSEKAVSKCLSNTQLSDALIKNMQDSARQWNVNSTPSFVINNQKLISGSRTVEALSAEIESFLPKP